MFEEINMLMRQQQVQQWKEALETKVVHSIANRMLWISATKLAKGKLHLTNNFICQPIGWSDLDDTVCLFMHVLPIISMKQ